MPRASAARASASSKASSGGSVGPSSRVALGGAVGARVEVRAAGRGRGRRAGRAAPRGPAPPAAARPASRRRARSPAGRSSRAPSRRAPARPGGAGSPSAAGAQLRGGDADQGPHAPSYRPYAAVRHGQRPDRPRSTRHRGASILRSSMSSQYIFTMYKLSRTHPPDKQVLKDISLSFMPGAKIGVLGLNGSGKSTLLRIMAGQDTEYRGEAQLAPGATVGLLEQEPQLDESKDVRGNVEDGVAELRAPARPLQRARRQLLRRDRRRVRAPAGADRRGRRLEPRHPARPGDGRAAAAARRRRRHEALRRRAPPRRALPAAARARPTCCCSTSRPTTSTPSRSPGSSSTSRSTRAPSWPSPTIATSSTTSRAGSSSSTAATASRSRATTRAGSSRSRRASPRRSARSPRASARSQRELEWVRENPKGRRKKAKARLNNYERLLAEERNVKLDQVQIHIPAGPAPRRQGDRGRRRCARASATGC